jgi:hypothetical protein
VAGIALTVRARYGVADHRLKGGLRLAWNATPLVTLQASAYDERRDASDFAEASGLRNTIAAQEFGADFTEPYAVLGGSLAIALRGSAPVAPRITLTLARERTDSVPVKATPAQGTFRATPAVLREEGWRGELALLMPRRAWWSGSLETRASFALRHRPANAQGARMPGRAVVEVRYERPAGSNRVVLSTLAGATSSPLSQDLFRAGGPVSGPGYSLHQFEGTALLSQRIEWQFPVRFPSIPLGRWGATPARARLAPFGTVVVRRGGLPGSSRVEGYTSAGVALIVFFDLVRVDIARGLRGGRWTLGLDLTRDLWPIL